MSLNKPFSTLCMLAVVICLAGCTLQKQSKLSHIAQDTLYIEAARFTAGTNMEAPSDSGTIIRFIINEKEQVPFAQSVVRQNTEQALLGPDPSKPYFTVRYALPIPPSYTSSETAELAGLGRGIYHHNHSPGFEIMPNGDALAIYFSSPLGKTENDTATTFVQARLRYGSDEWDMPEVFFDTRQGNDQSGLLWNDNGTIWFFGGGRSISNHVPFRMAVSIDNGASWTFSVPILDSAATSYTAQPIVNAFRDPKGGIYMACDGDDSESFLWYSADNGRHWQDRGGRTSTRHSTIIPLDDQGTLLSLGGKNAIIDGWNVKNTSHDWGKTWNEPTPSGFPPLGSAQRPSLIRLASGKLLYVTDAYMHKKKINPNESWSHGLDAVVALSDDNGKTWRIKPLPIGLPQHHRPTYTSIGYSTVRQAPNGIIHVLTTTNYPPLHYAFNEAWVLSDEPTVELDADGGTVQFYEEHYPSGALKATWSALLCADGRYLLHGKLVDFYENGRMEHMVDYENGRKTGEEVYYTDKGSLVWKWQRDLNNHVGVWTKYWPNGNKKVESTWQIDPEARDLKRPFNGYAAHGPSRHWLEDGTVTGVYYFRNGVLETAEKNTIEP